MKNTEEIYIELKDDEWPFEYTDHDRMIARAIVYDDSGYFYFVRVQRDDHFGKATLIETSGGGVEKGEDLESAVKRELKEELGAEAEVVCKLGIVSDYYNLIHRHNINNYYLCKALSFGEKHLMPDEIEDFHLSTLRLSYEEAEREYEKRRNTPLGRLIANRELPMLRKAKEVLSALPEKSSYDRSPGKKIIILGCPGSGKSTLARNLQSKTGLPLYHLDNIWWKPDRTHISRDEFDEKLEALLREDAWIIDGDYSRTYEVRFAACDTVIFLDYDEEECMKGICSRIGEERTDIPWTESSIDPELVAEVRNYRSEKRPVILSLIEKYPGKQVLIFKSREEAQRWLSEN